jgi:hypothetical protein
MQVKSISLADQMRDLQSQGQVSVNSTASHGITIGIGSVLILGLAAGVLIYRYSLTMKAERDDAL